MTAAGFAAAVSVFGLLGLAGCDSHSKPTVPTEAPQSPDSVSPSPTPSPVPATNSAPTASLALPTTEITGLAALTSAYPSAAAAVPAAVQVVRNFFDAINYETDTGDESKLIRLYTPKCKNCSDEAASIKALYQNGRTLRGGHVHLVSIDKAYPSYSQVVTVVVTETQDAGDQLDAHGNLVEHFDAEPPTKLVFNLQTDQSPPLVWLLDSAGK